MINYGPTRNFPLSASAKALIDEAREGIISVLKGETESFGMIIGPPIDDLFDILHEQDADFDSGDMETNGWEVEYWCKNIDYQDQVFNMDGSLWYGDFIFYKEKE